MGHIFDIMQNSDALRCKFESTNIGDRCAQLREVDLMYIDGAEQIARQTGVNAQTLFIINTGHSIPIGVHLNKVFGMSLSWPHRDLSKFDPIAVNRILQQIKLFPTENNKPHTLSSETAILFDAHYQDSIATVLPTTADLIRNGINKIIIMDESAICTDPRKISESHPCYRFVCECNKNAIEVNVFGIKAPDHHDYDYHDYDYHDYDYHYHMKTIKLPCLPGGGGGIFNDDGGAASIFGGAASPAGGGASGAGGTASMFGPGGGSRASPKTSFAQNLRRAFVRAGGAASMFGGGASDGSNQEKLYMIGRPD